MHNYAIIWKAYNIALLLTDKRLRQKKADIFILGQS
jgi:hypothetical protein